MFALLAVFGVLVVAVAIRATGNARPGTSPQPRLHPDILQRVLEWGPVVDREAAWPGLARSLTLAVIARESGGKANAHGSAGELGLMQVTKGAWQDYARENEQDAEASTFEGLNASSINIRVGSWYLARKIEEMGSRYDGLRAYNCGAVGARRNPTCGADYARWVLETAEPSFKGA